MFTGFGFNDLELGPRSVLEIAIAVWNIFCDDCSSYFSPCLTLKHTKSISLADLLSMTYPKIFAQHQPGETSHDYTLCFSTAAAAAPPSASHLRRPRRDAAAFCGCERPCRRGRAADLCGGHNRPWPRKGFRVLLRVALTR